MRTILGALTATLALAVAAAGSAPAADPSSGTLSPSNPVVTFTGGPFTGANPSIQFPGATEPDCDNFPGTCDDFALTIDLPAGYLASNPDHVVTFKLEWSNPRNDFDMYVQDPGTGQSKTRGATGAEPEFAFLEPPLLTEGISTCRVRIVAFSVVADSYTATITLGPAPTFVPRTGTYVASGDIWSCDRHLEGGVLVGTPPTTFDHGLDAEPSMRFDPNGTAYVSAIAGVPAGAGLWRTADGCGQAYEFIGAPDAGIGGGDSDIEIAPEVNPATGFHNIYISSLTLANVTTSVSVDGGQTFTVQPISTIVPLVDRQWNAAHGPLTAYLSYRNGATQPGNLLEVVRWDNGGLGAPGAGPFVVWDPVLNPVEAPKQLGNMTTDRRPLPPLSPPLLAGPDGEGTVYHGFTQGQPFTLEPHQQVWMAVSRTFGVTWENKLVFEGGPNDDFDNLFTWTEVDDDGVVYTAFSDGSNIYYSYSEDQGETWSHPIRVNSGVLSRTCLMPQLQAGSRGRLAFAFIGHEGTVNDGADWKVFVVRTNNALDPVPTFEERIVSNRQFHIGEVCLEGVNCECCRQLLECFEIDINPVDGSAFVAYGSQASGTWITRQLSGVSSLAGKTVPDRSAVCPSPENGCVTPPLIGSPCEIPGVQVGVDLGADTPPTPLPSQDVQSVHLSEPFGDPVGPNVLVFSLRMAAIDPNDLPPNTMWRVFFTVGGVDRWINVVHCVGGQTQASYGHFDIGSVTDGPADAFSFSADGVVSIWLDKAKLGGPGVGTLITGVQADIRQISGNCPGGPSLFAPLDASDSGQYALFGNDFCQPPGVSCPADFAGPPDAGGTPIDYPVQFAVTNPSTVARSFDVSLTDTKGWILGGSVQTTLGPVAPGGSATLDAIVRMAQDCQTGEQSVLTWSVTATDESEVSAECQTTVTCDRPVPALVSRLEARPSGGVVELTWLSNAVGEVTGWNLYRGATPNTILEPVNEQPIPMGEGGRFTWSDRPSATWGTVYYRLTGIARDGSERLVALTSVELTGTQAFTAALAGMNPFRDHTSVRYTLPRSSPVRVEVYNVAGKRVRTLADGVQGPGSYTVSFDLQDANGGTLGPGVYVIRVQAGPERRSFTVVAVP